MANQRTESSEGMATPAMDLAASVTPVPAATLRVTFTVIAKGDVLHRVRQDKYLPDQFNPGVHGNARFSPIQDDQGRAIPTLYGGTTVDCALMETVFHDVSPTAGFKCLDKGKLTGQVHSAVQVGQALRLVDLSSAPLRKLGITRKQLIDTEKDQDLATRKWAEAIHRQCPDAQGLSWCRDKMIRHVRWCSSVTGFLTAHSIRRGASRSLTGNSTVFDTVLNLAERIGVVIIAGKS